MKVDFYEYLYNSGKVDAFGLAELYRHAAQIRKRAHLALLRASSRSLFDTGSFASALWTCHDDTGKKLWVRTAENLWTTVGATWLIGNALTGGSLTATYLGMIAGASSPTLAIGDTSASHAGWTEVASADVVQVSRPTITWGSPSGGVVSNAAALVTYQMASALVDTRTLQGGFLIDNATLGGTSGSLISEAAFDQGPATVGANNIVTVLVTVMILAG